MKDASSESQVGPVEGFDRSHLTSEGALLVSLKSRRGREAFARSRTLLEAQGINLTTAKALARTKDLVHEAQRLVAAGAPLVVIGGGDGTLSAVARHFARQETVMGVLPLGTGNSFARDLGIPMDLDAACRVIGAGHVAKADMGVMGDREFLNVATVGLSTRVALGLTPDAKKRFGRAAYLLSLIKGLATVSPFRVRLELPSGDHEFDSLQVVIGNGRFHAGPFPVSPDASITGGWLAVYALASRRKSAFLKMALHMRGGRHVDLSEVRAFRTQSGRLETTPVQRVTVDGEVSLTTPVDFGIVPGALRVLVPG